MDSQKIREEFHIKFVEPIETECRIMNLNNEFYVNGKEEDVLEFIFQKLAEVRRETIVEKVKEIKGLKYNKKDLDNTHAIDFAVGMNNGIDKAIEMLKL